MIAGSPEKSELPAERHVPKTVLCRVKEAWITSGIATRAKRLRWIPVEHVADSDRNLGVAQHPFFVAAESGRQQLWLRSLDKSEAQPLAGTEGAVSPFWSADSRWIGYFASGKLNRIDSNGGPPQPLANASGPSFGPRYFRRCWLQAARLIKQQNMVSRDGRFLITSRLKSPPRPSLSS